MDILLAAATRLEIQPTIDSLKNTGFRAGDNTIQILITGVGSVATTYQLTRRIRDSRPDLVLQAGIAGCFTGRKNGDLIAVKEEILADLGVWEDGSFKTLFDMNLADRNAPPFTNGGLVNPFQELLSLSGLEAVRSLSVNEITTAPDRIAWYQQNWSPVVESMEGGAMHYTCIRENLPFLQLRALSNRVGDRDKTRWDFPAAIGTLNGKLASLLSKTF
ncbi:MAG: futalosine hydrolase [Puia sp.]|nr:futalosine hydrolase [Puia sp.]